MNRLETFLLGVLFIAIVILIGLVIWLMFPPPSTTISSPDQITAHAIIPPDIFGGTVTNPQQIDVTVTVPKSGNQQDSSKDNVLALILGGLLALLGSAIGLIYNAISARSARQFEWSRSIWDKYQKEYLELRSTVVNTIDLQVLVAKREAIKYVIFPPKVNEEIDKLVQSYSRGDVERENFRNRFIRFYDDFLIRPWKYL